MTATTRRTVLELLLTAVCGQGQTDSRSADEWNAFLTWLEALPSETFPKGQPAVVAAYKAKLVQDGVSPAESDQIISRIRTQATADNQKYQALWYDKTYSRKTQPGFRTAPNEFLVEVASKLPPGAALDVGMGEGRNSIFLAQQRWNVTGIDLSEAGVSLARKRADSLGLKLNAIVQGADQFDYGEERWDLVCMLYFSGYNSVHDLEKRVAASLKRGGWAIVEGAGQLGNPKTLTEPWSHFEPLGLRLIRLEYRAEKSDWEQPSFGRMLLQKP